MGYTLSFNYAEHGTAGHNINFMNQRERLAHVDNERIKDNVELINIYKEAKTGKEFEEAKINYLKEVSINGLKMENRINEYNEGVSRPCRYKSIEKELELTHKNYEGVKDTMLHEHGIQIQIGSENWYPEDQKEDLNGIYEKITNQLNKCPGIYITTASIHHDEGAPHLAISFFTITEKGDRGLGLKYSMNEGLNSVNKDFNGFRDKITEWTSTLAEHKNIKLDTGNHGTTRTEKWKYEKENGKIIRNDKFKNENVRYNRSRSF